MFLGLDTSVVLRLLTGEPSAQFIVACAAMREAEAGGIKLMIDNLVVAESYHALQHHYGLTKSEALRSILALLDTGSFLVHPSLIPALRTENIASTKPDFLDRLIHSAYRDASATLLTFEKAARKLDGVRVLESSSA